MKVQITRNEDGSISVSVPTQPIGVGQVGRLIISDDVFKYTGRDIFNDGLLFAVMSQIIVVRCEYLFASRSFEYYAYSPHFKDNEPGCVPPLYQVVVDKVEGEVVSFEFVETSPVQSVSGVRI